MGPYKTGKARPGSPGGFLLFYAVLEFRDVVQRDPARAALELAPLGRAGACGFGDDGVDALALDLAGDAVVGAGALADATPRSSSCPRRSGSGTFPAVSPPSYGGVVKKKRTADSVESLCV